MQDECVLNDKFRLVAGARVDKFSSIDDAVFSPRVALVMQAECRISTFRVSLQPRLPRAVDDQQQPRTYDRDAASARR